jgi:predicted Zn-dependent peptidase
MDTKNAPDIEKVMELSVPSQQPFDHIHATPVYAVEDETENLVKIEFVFPAGSGEEHKQLLATSTSSMLMEGAGQYTSGQISETKDYYGAKIQTGVGKDVASVTLVCLKSNLEELIPLVCAIIQAPHFPEKEFESYKRRTKAHLKVNLEKVEISCRLVFSELFFGESKYAERYDPEDFDKIEIADLKAFHQNNYRLKDAQVYMSGASIQTAISLLKENLKADESALETKALSGFGPHPQKKFIRKEGALQSAIRVGFPAISRHHEDYPAFYLTNTILGGYFGSRLMQNIREDKGYTYGIGSSINHLKDLTYVVISTQVGAAHTEATLTELNREVDRLRSEAVSSEELDLVKNYTAGALLRSFDGTFSQASLLNNMLVHGLSESYYAEFLEKIYAVAATDITRIAQIYFDPKKFTIAVVGEGFSDND